MTDARSQPMQTLTSSESTEWYTPAIYATLARAVMGSIDLDPASHPKANLFIKARRYFTIEDDALNRDWGNGYTRIFLNPPYGKIGNLSSAEVWSEKLLHELMCGNADQAIMLTKAVPGYRWWDRLFNGGWPGHVCITKARISFINGAWVNDDGTYTVPIHRTVNGRQVKFSNISKAASCFWYIGNNQHEFKTVFAELGRVICLT